MALHTIRHHTIGLENNHLQSLKDRKGTATRREAIRIQVNPSHPCHSLLPALADDQYNLRKTTKVVNINFRKLRDINNPLWHVLVNISYYTKTYFN